MSFLHAFRAENGAVTNCQFTSVPTTTAGVGYSANTKNAPAAGETIFQVSDRLGFEYPQHFSRMFKKQEGVTPSEYCQQLRM